MDDGYYLIRVEATDAASNAPGQARTGFSVSRPFLIDNSPPRIARRLDGAAPVRFSVEDAFSIIATAELVVDGEPPREVLPEDGLFDDTRESFVVDTADWEPGRYSLVFEVEDEAGNRSVHRGSVTVD
jgi:hypothetical protein